MIRKLLTVPRIAAILAAVVLLGGLSAGSIFAQSSNVSSPAQATVQRIQDDDQDEANLEEADIDDVEEEVGDQNEADMDDETGDSNGVDEQQPVYAGTTTVENSRFEGKSEAEETSSLQAKATTSAANAEATALTANPGTKVVKTEIDNENGVLVYSVELDNGTEVKIDAGNGQILYTEVDEFENDTDSEY
jgi:uncharacterized membrane protein YkoI